MTATPSASGGVRTSAESVTSLVSLSRRYVNNAGQVTHADRYQATGGSYSDAADWGTLNTHRYRSEFAYDARGRMKRAASPTGSIGWSVFDGLGRLTSTWVGTDDAGATNGDPDGSGGASNMVKVASYLHDTYDAAAPLVGGSLLTRVTAHPAGGAADRVTQFHCDWRGRQVASKSGV